MRVGVLCLAVAAVAEERDAYEKACAAAAGCFYVWQPNLRYKSGGALVMHQLAGALRRQQACVRMAHVHPRLAPHVGDTKNLSEAEVTKLFAEGIGPMDTLISTEVAPEFALVEDDSGVPHLLRNLVRGFSRGERARGGTQRRRRRALDARGRPGLGRPRRVARVDALGKL